MPKKREIKREQPKQPEPVQPPLRQYRAEKSTCGRCQFWDSTMKPGQQLEPFQQGRCHRLPPPWPTVRADDWCGEYQAR